MQCDAVALMRLQEPEDVLVTQASRGLDPEFVAILRVRRGIAASGRAVAEGRPVAIPDVHEMYEQLKKQDELPGALSPEILDRVLREYHAMLAVPLVVRNEPYGAISLYFREAREFTDEDLQEAAALADQAALAIESARLRDRPGSPLPSKSELAWLVNCTIR
jgi:GAF domain-containing protein